MTQTLKALAARGVDALNHSSVQPWSAGPLFPCVIAKVERYDRTPYVMPLDGPEFAEVEALESRLQTQWWELTLDGRTEAYATREDAEAVARRLVADPILRAKWNRYPNGLDYTRQAAPIHDLLDESVPAEVMAEHQQYLAACERSVREGVAS